MRSSETLKEENLERAYIIMARIVRDCGDKYMPLFKRMHDMREQANAKGDLKNLALRIAKDTLI